MNDLGSTGTASDAGEDIDAIGVLAMIPHRYPFLMIDRVRNVVRDRGAIGVKNVSHGEPFFQGHFPSRPVMPGVLIVEAMAQTAAVVVIATLGEAARGKLVYFMSVENARFRRPVLPGDTLLLEVTKRQKRGPVWKFDGVGRVEDAIVAEATFTAMIRDHT
jgi:3-hydroxyacyl-[acyl-carrier-protein] dehydratase